MGLWWLSFSDEQACLGVAIVDGDDVVEATMRAHMLGINPGGQVLGIPVPPDDPDAVASVEQYGTDRLISVAELKAAGEKSIREAEDDGDIPRGVFG